VTKDDSEKEKRKNMTLFSKPKGSSFLWRGGLMLTVFQSNKFELSSSSSSSLY